MGFFVVKVHKPYCTISTSCLIILSEPPHTHIVLLILLIPTPNCPCFHWLRGIYLNSEMKMYSGLSYFLITISHTVCLYSLRMIMYVMIECISCVLCAIHEKISVTEHKQYQFLIDLSFHYQKYLSSIE